MFFSIVSLLIVIMITMLITRLAALALVLTGMSKESAVFQARSALSGVGFTTKEAEAVVNHPVRRQIVMMLMMIGSISFPTVVAALGVSLFTTFQADDWWWPLLFLLAGVLFLLVAGRNRWIEKNLNRLMSWGLHKWTDLDVRDYVSLLQLRQGFAVTEMIVEPDDWLAQKTLQQAALAREGVLTLGIQRVDGSYVGAPGAGDTIRPGDRLILYGRLTDLRDLDQRTTEVGDLAHLEATVRHQTLTRVQPTSED